MLAPNNSSSWSNQTLIYVGDFATSASQSFACFLDLLTGLQIRRGLIAFPSTPLLFSFVFLPLLSSILWISPASGFVFIVSFCPNAALVVFMCLTDSMCRFECMCKTHGHVSTPTWPVLRVALWLYRCMKNKQTTCLFVIITAP